MRRLLLSILIFSMFLLPWSLSFADENLYVEKNSIEDFEYSPTSLPEKTITETFDFPVLCLPSPVSPIKFTVTGNYSQYDNWSEITSVYVHYNYDFNTSYSINGNTAYIYFKSRSGNCRGKITVKINKYGRISVN